MTGAQVVKLNYSTAEAAAAIGVSERTLKQWVRKGLVPSHKIGNRRLFNVRQLEEWNARRADEWREEQRVDERLWSVS